MKKGETEEEGVFHQFIHSIPSRSCKRRKHQIKSKLKGIKLKH